MNGTTWTAPGQGATAGELYIATEDVSFTSPDVAVARARLFTLLPISRTNLRITGPLVPYDLERIAVCEVGR